MKDYQKAIELTINKDPQSPPLGAFRLFWTKLGLPCGIFQVVMMVTFLVVINTGAPMISGIGILEKEPKSFECLKDG